MLSGCSSARQLEITSRKIVRTCCGRSGPPLMRAMRSKMRFSRSGAYFALGLLPRPLACPTRTARSARRLSRRTNCSSRCSIWARSASSEGCGDTVSLLANTHHQDTKTPRNQSGLVFLVSWWSIRCESLDREFIDFEPFYRRITPKPRQLPLSELPCRTLHGGDRRLQAAGAAQVRTDLAVADAAQRRQLGAEAAFPEAAHFLDEAAFDHVAAARIEAGV